MNIFRKLFGKKKNKKEKQEAWYNDSHERIDKPIWTSPEENGGTFDGAQFDMAVTNSIAKRQH